MSYNITKETGLDPEEYGCTTRYLIDFQFERQKANVTIDIHKEDPIKARLSSNTDGYHWLQFWLCQDPYGELMKDLPFGEEVARCRFVFGRNQIAYEQEDKETAWLTWYSNYPIESFVRTVARIIEPRFALREKYFPD